MTLSEFLPSLSLSADGTLAPPSYTDEKVRTLMDCGTNLMMRGKYDEAIARFNWVLRMDEAFAEAYNKRATSHFLAGRHDLSYDDAMKTLTLEPQHFAALTGKGLSCYHLGDFKKAIKAFSDTLAIHPWSSNVVTTMHHTVKHL